VLTALFVIASGAIVLTQETSLLGLVALAGLVTFNALVTVAVYRREVTFDGRTLTKRTLLRTKSIDVNDVQSATVHITNTGREQVAVYRSERTLAFLIFDIGWWDRSLELRDLLVKLGSARQA